MPKGEVKRGRTMQQRLGVRWPGLAQRMTASVMRRPVGSRLRRIMLLRAARDGFDAWTRGDLDAASFLDDPALETRVEQSSEIPVGFDPVYHGAEGHCRVMEIWDEAWKSWRGGVTDVFEVGQDQILGVSQMFAEGFASGVELEAWGAGLYTFRHGKLVRLEARWDVDRDRLLEAFARKGIEVPPAARATPTSPS